jgi:hypothetical protein
VASEVAVEIARAWNVGDRHDVFDSFHFQFTTAPKDWAIAFRIAFRLVPAGTFSDGEFAQDD